jgi:hypothetical protein
MIYEIICWTTGLRYVGATKVSLKERLKDHKRKRKTNTSRFVIEHNNYEIYLLEKCEIQNLKEREDYYIRHTDCVNARGEIRNRKESLSKYNNSKKGKETHKKYHNSKKGKETQKLYNNSYKKTETYQNSRKKRYFCTICNIDMLYTNRNAHFKSKRHKDGLI